MTRTFRHRPFRLEYHLARLYRSEKYAYIDISLDQEEMIERTQELIDHHVGLIGEHDDLG